MADGGDISKQLYESSRSYADLRGYKLGVGADQDFHSAANRAGSDLAPLSGVELERELQRYTGRFHSVISRMVEASFDIEGYREGEPGVLGEQTLSWALRDLCPFPPFC